MPDPVIQGMAENIVSLSTVLTTAVRDIARLQATLIEMAEYAADLERRLGDARVVKAGISPARTFPPDAYELYLPPMRQGAT